MTDFDSRMNGDRETWDETSTPYETPPTDTSIGNPPLSEYLPDAAEDVTPYSGMVHPWPTNAPGNANAAE